MLSRFWLQLGKLIIGLLLLYLLLAYLLLVTIIVRQEIQILDPEQAISVLNPEKGPSSFQGQVRNVFGDPVPHAVIIIGEQLIQADNTGSFFLGNLQSGRHTLEIFAGDYEKYKREIQLDTGINSPPIKYESGLWPQLLLVDFHVYYKDYNELFGIIGFANGSNNSLFIQKASLLDPAGEFVSDLLHDNNGFAYFADLSSKLQIVLEPQKALEWPGRIVQSGEFNSIKGNFKPGPYTLEVHYGFKEEHELGLYRVLTITDHLDLNADPNPHLP